MRLTERGSAGGVRGMRQTAACLVACLVAGAAANAIAWSGLPPAAARSTVREGLGLSTVVRTIGAQGTESPDVSLAASPAMGTSAYAVEDTLEAGLTAVNISAGGAWDSANHKVKWGPFFDDSARTLTYEVTGPDGTYAVTGVGSFDGVSVPTTGDSSLTIEPCEREVRVVSALGAPGSTVTVPVNLVATGEENALSFSLTYDSTILTVTDVDLGADAAAASLTVNTTVTERVGIVLWLATGQTFPSGDSEVALVSFTIATGAVAGQTPIAFADTPTVREVADALGGRLTANWQAGEVTVAAGYEADVTPRPSGDGVVSATDLVQVARFVVGLDTPACLPASSEFMRADCAPLPRGDGRLSAADVVVAARYVVGLELKTPAGGPGCFDVGVAQRNGTGPLGEPRAVRPGLVSVSGTRVSIPLTLIATGNENALSFAFTYDQAVLTDPVVTLGGNAGGASLLVNTTEKGRVVAVLWLGAGEVFEAGDCEVALLSFRITAGASAEAPSLAFVDAQADCEVADVQGNSVPAVWNGVTIGKNDSDGDGATDWREYVAGTSATDPEECFKISECMAQGVGGTAEVRWDTVPGRWYTVYLSTNLLEGNWTEVCGMAGDGSRKSFSIGEVPLPQAFLRVGVRLQESSEE
jgi:hypothetical protein